LASINLDQLREYISRTHYTESKQTCQVTLQVSKNSCVFELVIYSTALYCWGYGVRDWGLAHTPCCMGQCPIPNADHMMILQSSLKTFSKSEITQPQTRRGRTNSPPTQLN